jgi:hypothetical protein
MAKKQNPPTAPADNALKNVSDYRFPEATRKNNPPAKIAAEGHVPLIPKAEYFYSPRRPPELRFDPTGREDELPEGDQRQPGTWRAAARQVETP